MASYLWIDHPATGQSNLYAVLRAVQGVDAGKYWNGSVLAAYNSSDWGSYDIGLNEDAASFAYRLRHVRRM